MPDAVVEVADVQQHRTRSGNTRFVLVDDRGREFSTFREEVAARLDGLKGRRARIEYHEERRGNFTNVYLDRVELLPAADDTAEEDASEAAWRMALEAAPYLLGGDAVERETPAEELYEKLKPFQELVEDDLDQTRGDEG